MRLTGLLNLNNENNPFLNPLDFLILWHYTSPGWVQSPQEMWVQPTKLMWKYENGAWVSGLYVIKKKFRYFKLFFNGKFIDNFQSLQAAKDAV
jgi:hypothetical protein